jgi:F-type H+-transporting ATPase subunit delta
MKEKIIAKRYAEAFLGYARETIGQNRAIEDFKKLKAALYENPQLGQFLNNPEIAIIDKSGVINRIFKENFSEETRQFLKLLLEKDRIRYITDICDYVRVTYSHGESLEGVLKASYPLDLEVIQEIKSKLENKFQKKINLYLELDPDLLGGIQIRIGNTVIDGSVRRRLDELKKKLMLIQVG